MSIQNFSTLFRRWSIITLNVSRFPLPSRTESIIRDDVSAFRSHRNRKKSLFTQHEQKSSKHAIFLYFAPNSNNRLSSCETRRKPHTILSPPTSTESNIKTPTSVRIRCHSIFKRLFIISVIPFPCLLVGLFFFYSSSYQQSASHITNVVITNRTVIEIFPIRDVQIMTAIDCPSLI